MNSTIDDQGRPKRLPWIVLAVIAALAIGGVVAYYVARDVDRAQKEERQQRRLAARGSACELLRTAARAFESGDERAFSAAIEEARRRAELALDSDDYSFGKAEKMALYLSSEDDLSDRRARPRIQRRLNAASEYCSKLDA